MPIRLQRKRTKDFRLPPGTVCVTRGTKWGNPFKAAEYGKERAVRNYRGWILGMVLIKGRDLEQLRGKNLACYCPLDQPCHADVLLDLANR